MPTKKTRKRRAAAGNLPFIGIHGYNGQGKSTVAQTLPGPILVADSEGRGGVVLNRVGQTFEEWAGDDFPALAEEDTVVWPVESYEDMQEFIDYLEKDNDVFASAVVDSLLVVQEYYRLHIMGVDLGDIDSWKEGDYSLWSKLKYGMIADLKRLAKLTRGHRDNPISIACVVPTNRDDEKPRRPDVDGALARRLIGIFDMQCAAVKTRSNDEEGGFDYDLLIDIQESYEEDEFETKCDIPSVSAEFDNVIPDPNLARDIVAVMQKESNS